MIELKLKILQHVSAYLCMHLLYWSTYYASANKTFLVHFCLTAIVASTTLPQNSRIGFILEIFYFNCQSRCLLKDTSCAHAMIHVHTCLHVLTHAHNINTFLKQNLLQIVRRAWTLQNNKRLAIDCVHFRKASFLTKMVYIGVI